MTSKKRDAGFAKRDPEPPRGSWVIAAYSDCPSRYYWQRVGNDWIDEHGCARRWDQLVEPIDALPPEVP